MGGVFATRTRGGCPLETYRKTINKYKGLERDLNPDTETTVGHDRKHPAQVFSCLCLFELVPFTRPTGFDTTVFLRENISRDMLNYIAVPRCKNQRPRDLLENMLTSWSDHGATNAGPGR